MKAGLIHAAAGALLLAGASPALAQAGRNWIDPPTDLPAVQNPPAPAEVKPPVAEKSDAKEVVPQKKPVETEQARAAPSGGKKTAAKPKEPREAKVKPRPRDTFAARTRRPSERLTVAREPERQADAYAGAGGYEVMRLRTYELPDGRRIQVLTRPPAPTYPPYQTYPYYR